ncbi:MAG: hypothetical protein HYY37_04900 [Candidatus Aenigmarchaeota archaeon]|nr:hypothetical protein [Candidatus Aenigmarchaeota archaeon]
MIYIDIRKVADEIIREAEARAKELQDEGKRERERILAEARKEMAARKEELNRSAERAIEQARVREAAKARMKSKEIMHRALMDAIESLYKSFYAGLEKDRDSTLGMLYELGKKDAGDIGTLYVAARDIEAAKKLFPVVKAAPIKGGVILESKDGSTTINLSMELIDEIIRSRTFGKVHAILFGKR